jgi:hypothetical protein
MFPAAIANWSEIASAKQRLGFFELTILRVLKLRRFVLYEMVDLSLPARAGERKNQDCYDTPR